MGGRPGVDRTEYRSPARTAAEPLRDSGPEFPIPLFRAEKDALPAPRARGRGVPRRLRHLRRDVRAVDANSDGEGATAPDPAVRQGLLEPRRQFRRDGRGRSHFAARPRPHPLVGKCGGSLGVRAELLRRAPGAVAEAVRAARVMLIRASWWRRWRHLLAAKRRVRRPPVDWHQAGARSERAPSMLSA